MALICELTGPAEDSMVWVIVKATSFPRRREQRYSLAEKAWGYDAQETVYTSASLLYANAVDQPHLHGSWTQV